MAAVLRLANYDQTVTADILSGDLVLTPNGWQAGSRGLENTVVEIMRLVGTGTKANIRTATDAIDDILVAASNWHTRPFNQDSFWLEANSDGESVKRSLIMAGSELLPLTMQNLGAMLLNKSGAFYDLVLERLRAWEEITADATEEGDTGISILGGSITIADLGGTLPGRIAFMDVIPNGNFTVDADECWIGIRDPEHGNPTQPIECEDAVALGTDTTSVVIAGASGGDLARCTFATDATMVSRVTFRGDDFGASANQLLGSWKLLLLGKVTGTAVVATRISTGFPGMQIVNNPIFVTNTSLQFYDLGNFSAPPFGQRENMDWVTTTNALNGFNVSIQAELISGTGNFDMDCVVLMPTFSLFHADGLAFGTLGGDRSLEIYTLEDESQFAVSKNASSVPLASTNGAFNNWWYPIDYAGTTTMVFAFSSPSGLAVARTVDVESLEVFPRWRNYRI